MVTARLSRAPPVTLCSESDHRVHQPSLKSGLSATQPIGYLVVSAGWTSKHCQCFTQAGRLRGAAGREQDRTVTLEDEVEQRGRTGGG